MRTSVKLIVYDLDGTLVDTRRDIVEAANHMRGNMGLSPMPAKEICGYVGLGLKSLVEGCLGTADSDAVEQGMRLYRAHYSEHLLDHAALYPGAWEVLRYFQPRRQAVITNKPNPYSRQILEALGVAGFFFEVVAGDSGTTKKPDPESLLALMRRESAAPSSTLLVGDSPIDVETGSKAGVLTVGLAQGFSDQDELERSGPDHLLGSFQELLELAKERRW